MSKIASASIALKRPLILIDFSEAIRYKTKGILSAKENAAIFLLAVTPFKSPETISPEEFNISIASFMIAIDSTPRIIVIIVEKKISLFFIL